MPAEIRRRRPDEQRAEFVDLSRRGRHQENGRRGGTENVPYIVGLGRACELAAVGIGVAIRALGFARHEYRRPACGQVALRAVERRVFLSGNRAIVFD